MKLWVAREGHDTEVEFEARGDRLWLTIEGRRLEADCRRLWDGEVYSVLIEGRSHEVRVSSPGGRLEVTLDGATIPVEVRHPLEKLLQATGPAARAGGRETVVAPMPGLVVALRVRPGDVVAAGQPVVVVEAMKMQNELATRGGGVVTDVLVEERTPVSAGQALVRIAQAGS